MCHDTQAPPHFERLNVNEPQKADDLPTRYEVVATVPTKAPGVSLVLVKAKDEPDDTQVQEGHLAGVSVLGGPMTFSEDHF